MTHREAFLMMRVLVCVLPCLLVIVLSCCMLPRVAYAGAQQYEALAASVQASMSTSLSDLSAPEPNFPNLSKKITWLSEMSFRLQKYIVDADYRVVFLKTVYYEASRAGLDPQLVLSIIQVESGFRKYAVSTAGARGLMQVMPFWVKLIGTPQHNLFHLRTNLRYGCTILRHYLDQEHGDLFRALGRYNGSVGKPAYPNQVLKYWNSHWNYSN